MIPPPADRVAGLLEEAAATAIMPRFRRLAAGDIRQKAPGDLVTVADEAVEARLSPLLTALVPGSIVLGEEAPLVFRTHVGCQSGMVWQCLETLCTQPIGDTFGLFARQAINNACFATMRLQELQKLSPFIAFDVYRIGDVRPVERCDENLRIVQLEPGHYFRACFIRRRGRHRHARDAGEHGAEIAQRQVVLAKIVAPLRHAVSLVDGDDGQGYVL